MSSPNYVHVEHDGDIALVTIDRQRKMNALNARVMTELTDAFAHLSGSDIRGVILTGAGERAFVAGADIAQLALMEPLSGMHASRSGQSLLTTIEEFEVPVLAAVGGYALGGGFELALACHLRVASDNAKFGLPEVGLGIIPGFGGTVRLPRIVGMGRAIELTLTGDPIDAAHAHEMGLVSAVHPRAELLDGAKHLMRRITRNGPLAVRLALESIRRALDTSSADGLAIESSLFGVLAGTEDMKEGMAAFLEKRKAEFSGR